jgi:hypothetical protein
VAAQSASAFSSAAGFSRYNGITPALRSDFDSGEIFTLPSPFYNNLAASSSNFL